MNVLAIVLLIPVAVLSQYQETECENLGGVCQLIDTVCSGHYVRRKCPSQPSNVKCCVTTAYQEQKCQGAGGVCQSVNSECEGTFLKGYCPTQPASVKCCVPSDKAVDDSDEFEYDYATGCSKGPQPGAKCLEAFIKARSPSGKSLGIHNCRKIRGSKTKYSLHAEGRALDWALNANNAKQRDEAESLITLFTSDGASLAKRMGIQEIIYNRRIWTYSNGFQSYRGSSPHTDHIHIGLNKKGARKETSFWQSYEC